MKRNLRNTTLVCMILMVYLGTNIDLCKGQFQFQLYNNASEFELRPSSENETQSFPTWSTLDNSKLQLIRKVQKASSGRVMYRNPIQFINKSSGTVFSFTTYIRFQLVTLASISGDGFTFFITPNINFPDSGGVTMGLPVDPRWNETDPSRHLLALEFDTFQNFEISDPSSSHIGIDINGIRSVNTTNSLDLYKSSAFIDSLLQYNGENGLISVWATPRNTTYQTFSTPSDPPILTYNVSNFTDLFENKMYVGLSAASGAVSLSVSVLSWSFIIYDNSTTTRKTQSPINSSTKTPIAPLQPSFDRSRPLLKYVALPIVLIAIVSAAAILVFCPMSKKINSSHSSAAARRAALAAITPNATRYTYRELKRATQGFRKQNKIGEGAFSEVYRGTLTTNGSAVAVKKLKEGVRIEDEFAYEVRVISKIRHKNLIELQGWCYDNNQAMLVYPFMERGSLDGYIFDKINEGLKGPVRLEILKGVAAALEYLHEGLGERVLHRDVKAANVLLTDSWEAKLGDFGLARLIDPANYNTAVTMTAAGTPGYVAPEVIYTGKVSDKADVYSYGVLALEVACGRRVVDGRLLPQEMRLIDWVWLLHQSGKLMEALDPRLNGSENGERTVSNDVMNEGDEQLDSLARLDWQCVLHVALLCCMPYPENRPCMRDVRHVLRERIIVPLPPVWPPYGSPSPCVACSLMGFSSELLSASTVSSGKSSSSLQLGRR